MALWMVPAAMAAFNLLKKKPKAPKYQPIDTSGILAEIDKLYAAQAQSTQANLARNLAGQQAQTAEGLAGRGIYSSPVSEYSFAENRKNNANSLADALSQIASNQASSKANVLGSAASTNAQQQYQSQLAKYQNQMESSNMLTSLLSNAAMAMYGAGNTAPAGTPAVPGAVSPVQTLPLSTGAMNVNMGTQPSIDFAKLLSGMGGKDTSGGPGNPLLPYWFRR